MRIIGSASSRAGFAGGALGVGSIGAGAELRGATVTATGAASLSAGFAGGALGVGSIGAEAELRGAAGSTTGSEGSGGFFGTGWLSVMGCSDMGGRDELAHAGGETGAGRPTDPANRGVRRKADGGDDATVGDAPAGTAEGGRV